MGRSRFATLSVRAEDERVVIPSANSADCEQRQTWTKSNVGGDTHVKSSPGSRRGFVKTIAVSYTIALAIAATMIYFDPDRSFRWSPPSTVVSAVPTKEPPSKLDSLQHPKLTYHKTFVPPPAIEKEIVADKPLTEVSKEIEKPLLRAETSPPVARKQVERIPTTTTIPPKIIVPTPAETTVVVMEKLPVNADQINASNIEQQTVVPLAELSRMIERFQEAYIDGDMVGIKRLFNRQILAKELDSEPTLRDYQKLFDITRSRDIKINIERWSFDQQKITGTGVFDLRMRERGASRDTVYKGEIHINVAQGTSGLTLADIQFDYQ